MTDEKKWILMDHWFWMARTGLDSLHWLAWWEHYVRIAIHLTHRCQSWLAMIWLDWSWLAWWDRSLKVTFIHNEVMFLENHVKIPIGNVYDNVFLLLNRKTRKYLIHKHLDSLFCHRLVYMTFRHIDLALIVFFMMIAFYSMIPKIVPKRN